MANDVDSMQIALNALIMGDRLTAGAYFTHRLVVTGLGGALRGTAVGLPGQRSIASPSLARLTDGTFGTEVGAVFVGAAEYCVVLTWHWASLARANRGD